MENNKESNDQNSKLVSYCGLYCRDCPLYVGKISNLARDLRRELRRVRYDKFAKYISEFQMGKQLEYFKECYVALGAMMKFQCEKGCRQGGGTDNCQIRKCCQDNNFVGCWQCTKFKHCTKLDALNALHGNTHRKNLKSIQKRGIADFIEKNKHW